MWLLLYLLPGALAITNGTAILALPPYNSLTSIYSSDYTRGYRYEGAGVLISSQYVLTTATVCSFYDKTDLSARLGSITRPADGSTAKGYLYLHDLIVHPQYDEETQDYDYCLLKLNQTVPNKPARLPLLPVSSSQPSNLVGWGDTTSEGDPVLTARRARVNLHRSCVDDWKGVRKITDRMNCNNYYAGSSASACTSDEGTPVYDDYGTTILGLSSFGSWSIENDKGGYDCTSRPRANVNSDVNDALLWITEHTGIELDL